MTLLVVGSNSRIAQRLISRLRRYHADIRVIGLDRGPSSTGVHEYHQVDLLQLDDPESSRRVRNVMAYSDNVLMLAAAVHDHGYNNAALWKLNLEVPSRLFEWLRNERGREARFLFFSTIAVYGECGIDVNESADKSPTTPYGRSKAACENRLRELSSLDDSPDLTVFRPAAVISKDDSGNLARLVAFASHYRVGFRGKSDVMRSFVDVEDVCSAVELALLSETTSAGDYNLASPPVDLRAVMAEVSRVARPLVRLPFPILAATKPSLSRSFTVSTEKARRVLGLDFNSFHAAFKREFG